ncbi:MmcQ/YjbR family DNA-binding protein [Limosilactobacillus frumenti]|uniref:MmcQ/YjbR family DNA-binding protein n=1 Tax=Limosilactobacillus frumenti TaxID=104955 RepID=UPI00070E5CAD|nr:MmcQ/YjbR family DNA-binding protein [Limosilactobacillus frumenti]MBA2914436.1 hypothetical protein [Limosilactobacillus frumenti]QFG73356.1 hypothetical protein LF145_08565 [Limosilactobacillus frumenti]
MSIEQRVFAKYRPDFAKFKAAGFYQKGSSYLLKQSFYDHQFQAQITVSASGKITGKVLDLASGEEYLPLRAIHVGAFAAQVKQAYIDLLQSLADRCFIKEPFHSPQANRLAGRINACYHEQPEFIFKIAPDYGVFREPQTQKWYGLVMNIDYHRIPHYDHPSHQKVEVMDLRIHPVDRAKLLKQPGIYPSFHLKGKNWLSVILDDTVSDNDIFQLIKASRAILTQPTTWLVPANPKYYDIMHAFDHTDTIIWKQSTSIRVNDTVLLYVTAPIKAIVYECRAVEVNIPYHYQGNEIKISHVMKVQLIRRFPPDKFTFAFLQQHGIKAVRGPRHLPASLVNIIK